MTPTEIVLCAFPGYVIVALIASVVIAAVTTDQSGNARSDTVLALAAFWPLALVGFALGSIMLTAWPWAVRKLNPNYKELR